LAKRDLNWLRDAYNFVAGIVAPTLPSLVPKLEITEVTKYRGQAVRYVLKGEASNVHTIRLSAHNLYVSPGWRSKKDYCGLFCAICHELAHATYFDHSVAHRELTEQYYNMVFERLGIKAPYAITR
jgi:hypothetical protein